MSFLPRSALLPASIALAVLAGPAFAVSDCELNGESVNPSNGATTRGKTGLMRCRDRDTGQLQREQELRGGEYVGLERFYRDGKLLRESNVNAQGNREGRHREFGPEGQVLVDAEYVNGDNRGLARRWHPNGRLERVDFHPAERNERGASASFNTQGQLRELRCGPQPQLAPAVDDAALCGFAGGPSQVELFDGRGRLVARQSWQQGQRLRHTALDEQGRVRGVDETDGARRTEREFAADGTLRRERERTLNGRETVAERLRQFSESGTLVREQRWAAGRPVSDQQFYLNGQPRSRTEWAAAEGGAARVVETEYRDDGKLASTGTWLEQRGRRQPTGAHQLFDSTGRLVAQTTYNERGRPTREQAWDAQGTLLRDDAVFEDGSRKAFAR